MRKAHHGSIRAPRRLRWARLSLIGALTALTAVLFHAPASASNTQTQSKPTAGKPSAARAASSHAVHAAAANTPRGGVVHVPAGKRGAQLAKGGKTQLVRRGGGLQCVPFARNASGIAVSGNAHQWWDHAAGIYARGQVPERGSVLSFRANRSMPLGHVAVVTRVVNARELEIDHANWAGPGGRKGAVTRGASVVDVSEANDWTAVRVALGRSGDYGSIYPADGFIYDRPDDGRVTVRTASITPAPLPELNSAPRDLRPLELQVADNAGTPQASGRGGYASVSYAGGAFEEVAEATAQPRQPVVRRKVERAGKAHQATATRHVVRTRGHTASRPVASARVQRRS